MTLEEHDAFVSLAIDDYSGDEDESGGVATGAGGGGGGIMYIRGVGGISSNPVGYSARPRVASSSTTIAIPIDEDDDSDDDDNADNDDAGDAESGDDSNGDEDESDDDVIIGSGTTSVTFSSSALASYFNPPLPSAADAAAVVAAAVVLASDDGYADEDAEAEDEHADFCNVCRQGGDLLCCSGCLNVVHKDCLVPPLSEIPKSGTRTSLLRSSCIAPQHFH